MNLPVVGLIGAGRMGRVHASAWKRLGASVIVYSHAGASQLAARSGLEVVESLEALLSRVDVVDIVTPSDTHAHYALRSIEAGRDVVCEKPIALTTRDARAIQDSAERTGVNVFPAHVARFTKPNMAAHRAIEKGRIGRVAVTRFHRSTAAPGATSWLSDDARSGGVVFDLMIHDLDQARWMCGDVETVYAVRSPSVQHDDTGMTSVHATLTHFGGAISQVTAIWGAPGTEFVTSFSLAGDEGVLKYDSRSSVELSIDLPEINGSKPARRALAAAQHNPYVAELEHFLDVRSGLDARVSCEDGVEAVRIAEAVSMSLADGAVVNLNRQHEEEMVNS